MAPPRRGLRLVECCRLRVKDLDFDRRRIVVREGQGDRDRAVPLPGAANGASAPRRRPDRPTG
ncbi:MAG: tyrosine-type recombinase/integrase [Thermoleophilia bacterium]|nr:tyrosine-type recombinase/integrase [Thermoleophilia bacterium]